MNNNPLHYVLIGFLSLFLSCKENKAQIHIMPEHDSLVTEIPKSFRSLDQIQEMSSLEKVLKLGTLRNGFDGM
jgi:hypothetical protein